MFRSLASSIFTLIAVLLFILTIILVWNGSSGITYKRVAMEGDKATVQVLDDYRKQKEQAQQVAMDDPEPVMKEPEESSGDGPPVVLWISIPGFRGDYIEKAETPTFDQLVSDGGSTNKMRPGFPCLTFPAHTTMATGTAPEKHGIPADFILKEDGSIDKNPTNQEYMRQEPIWTTATRQGINTLVHDWPMSQNQTGENAAAVYLKEFDAESSDEDRLNKALEAWKAAAGSGGGTAAPAPADGSDAPAMAAGDDAPAAGADAPAPAADGDKPAPAAPAAGGGNDAKKLRLVMLRLDGMLKGGLVNGPRTPETYEAVEATDKALGVFLEKVKADWENLAPKNANLVVFITTDHGLAELEKNVNIAHLLGDEMMVNCDIIAHDAIANLYFKDLPDSDGEKKIFTDKFDGELKKRIYFRTYTPDSLPDDYQYKIDGRIGDRVLVLKSGYAFSEIKVDEPVFDPAEGPGFFGGFGYPVAESIRMSGQVILTGFPNSPASGDFGEVGQQGFHATVCKILGIEPAEGAVTETLELR